MGKKIRILGLLLSVILCFGMGVPAFAEEEGGEEPAIVVSLDQSTLSTSEQDQTVTMTISAPTAITASAGDFVVMTSENAKFTSYTVPSDEDYQAVCNTDSNNSDGFYGKVLWEVTDIDSLEDGVAMTNFGTVTYTIPAGTPAGEYTLGIQMVNACTLDGYVLGEQAEDCSEVGAEVKLTIRESVELNTEPEVDGNATLTTPDIGWTKGTNTFSVQNTSACVVLVSNDGGETYERLEATETDNSNEYSFTATDVDEDTEIKVVQKGDLNCDGKVDVTDARKVLRISNNTRSATALEQEIADLNGDGNILVTEARKVLRAANGSTTLSW